jgi:oligopeptide transport system substrate-binding protein
VSGLARAVALLAAAVLGLAACTTPDAPEPEPEPVAEPEPEPAPPPQATEDDRRGGTLRVGLSIDPLTIDPRFVADEQGELVVDALFDPLVRLDERFRVVPAAATRWDISDDGREFTFYLRPATFHDGTPVTAQDFVRSFTRIADGTAQPTSFLAYLLASVEGAEAAQLEGEPLRGVEAVDERTLRIRLETPDADFLTTLSDPSLVPVPPIADDDPDAFAVRPIGNGPFLMTEPREPDAFLRLRRNADHHTPPLLDEVLFQIYPEDPVRDRQWEDLLDGQLQVAEVPADRRDEAVERFGRGANGVSGPGLLDGISSTVYLYGFDTTQPPFDDPAVRRAISLAVDREALATEVMQDTRVAADAIVPPSLPGAQPGACTHCRHDPDAARAELASAELEEPLESLTLTHNRGRTHAAIAERMAANIEDALGVEVDLDARDLQPFVQAVRRGEVAVFRLGWDPGEPGPGAYLRPLFHSSQVGLDNLTRYADPEVDALLDSAADAQDRSVAEARYRRAERRILQDAPAIPLLWYRQSRVVLPEVQDLTLSPLGRMSLSEAWLEPQS